MSIWAALTSLVSTQPDMNALRTAQSAFEQHDKRTAFQTFKGLERDIKCTVFENVWKLKGCPKGDARYGESKFYGLKGRVDCELNAKAIKLYLYPQYESEYCTPSHTFSYGHHSSSHSTKLAFGTTMDISIEPTLESIKHDYERDQQIDRADPDAVNRTDGPGPEGQPGFEGMVCNDYSVHDISSYT